jgi:hypothetical protein
MFAKVATPDLTFEKTDGSGYLATKHSGVARLGGVENGSSDMRFGCGGTMKQERSVREEGVVTWRVPNVCIPRVMGREVQHVARDQIYLAAGQSVPRTF